MTELLGHNSDFHQEQLSLSFEAPSPDGMSEDEYNYALGYYHGLVERVRSGESVVPNPVIERAFAQSTSPEEIATNTQAVRDALARSAQRENARRNAEVVPAEDGIQYHTENPFDDGISYFDIAPVVEDGDDIQYHTEDPFADKPEPQISPITEEFDPKLAPKSISEAEEDHLTDVVEPITKDFDPDLAPKTIKKAEPREAKVSRDITATNILDPEFVVDTPGVRSEYQSRVKEAIREKAQRAVQATKDNLGPAIAVGVAAVELMSATPKVSSQPLNAGRAPVHEAYKVQEKVAGLDSVMEVVSQGETVDEDAQRASELTGKPKAEIYNAIVAANHLGKNATVEFGQPIVVPAAALSPQNPAAQSTETATTPTTTPEVVKAPVAYFIGDSIGQGVTAAGLTNTLEANGWSLDQSDSQVGANISGSIPRIEADAANVAAASHIIIELGTNNEMLGVAHPSADSVTEVQSEITAMMAAIRKINPNADVTWVNVHATTTKVYESINQAISSLQTELGYNVADWDAYASAHPELNFDHYMGVHLDPNGYVAYAQFLANAIGKAPVATPPTTVAPATPPTTITATPAQSTSSTTSPPPTTTTESPVQQMVTNGTSSTGTKGHVKSQSTPTTTVPSTTTTTSPPPTTTTAPPAPELPAGNPESNDPNEIMMMSMTYLVKNLGIPVNIASIIMGNAQSESFPGPQPERLEGYYHEQVPIQDLTAAQISNTSSMESGWGIAQFTPVSKYIDWGTANGIPLADLNSVFHQLEFIKYQLTTEVRYRGLWIALNNPKTTIAEGSMLYMKYYEAPLGSTTTPFYGPAARSLPGRQLQAQNIFNTFNPILNPPPPPPTTTTTSTTAAPTTTTTTTVVNNTHPDKHSVSSNSSSSKPNDKSSN